MLIRSGSMRGRQHRAPEGAEYRDIAEKNIPGREQGGNGVGCAMRPPFGRRGIDQPFLKIEWHWPIPSAARVCSNLPKPAYPALLQDPTPGRIARLLGIRI